jgi:murein DD-endopeptidase MepM/ murein hydrolase activator NlpD
MYGGTVVDIGTSSTASYGYTITIESIVDGQTVKYMYAHMNAQSPLGIGDTVYAGQEVGTVGKTGSATGNHLHVEVWVNGSRENPDPNYTTTINYDADGNPASNTYNYDKSRPYTGYIPVSNK